MSPLSFLLLLAALLVVAGAMHAFLYRGLVRGFDIRSRATRWVLGVLLGVLAVSYPTARLLAGHAPAGAVDLAHGVACIWIGVLFNLVWIGIDVWILGRLLRVFGIRRVGGSRDHLLRRGAVVFTILAALAVSFAGNVVARGPAQIREAQVPVKLLTPDLANLTIVVASDLHAGALMTSGEVEKRVDEIMALKPDLILLPGDLLDHPPERLPEMAPILARLRAPSGVFATTGNHEYIVGAERTVAMLESVGIRVLRGESVLVPPGLVVSGEDDPSASRFGNAPPSIHSLLHAASRSVPTVHMVHTPNLDVSRARIAAGADLVVSGHTHGGQLWPFTLLTDLVYTLHNGLYRVEPNGYHVVTRGIGWWGPPLRLGAPPEVWRIRLVAPDAPATVDGCPAEDVTDA